MTACNRDVHKQGGRVPAKQLRHAAGQKASQDTELQHTVALPTSCDSHKVALGTGTALGFPVTHILIGFTMLHRIFYLIRHIELRLN